MTAAFSGLVLWPLYACSAIMVGFSGATISFTAWNLVLPLLLKFFQIELFPALFISVCLDFVNSIILTVFYGYHRKISFSSGLIFSLVSAPVALIVSLSTGHLLLDNQKYLEGGVGYLPFILAVVFFIRGVVTLIKDYKAKKQRGEQAKWKAMENIRDSAHLDQRELDEIDDDDEEGDVDHSMMSSSNQEVIGSSISSPSQMNHSLSHHRMNQVNVGNEYGEEGGEEDTFADVGDDFSQLSKSASHHHHHSHHHGHQQSSVQSPTATANQLVSRVNASHNHGHVVDDEDVENGSGEGMPIKKSVAPLENDGTDPHNYRINLNDDAVFHSDMNAMMMVDSNSHGSVMGDSQYLRPLGQPAWKYYLTQRFAVESGFGNDMILSTDFSTKQKIIRTIITCVIMAMVGGISGLVYVGGGMIINVVLVACWKVDQKVATATGCFCTLLCMFGLSLTFIGTASVYTMSTLYFIAVGIPCCFVGAVVGAFLSLRISNMATFFTISAVLLVLGIVITVEGQL